MIRNREGTLNFQNRVHKIGLKLTLKPSASTEHPSDQNLELTYLDTVLFTDPQGAPTTGIDADAQGPYLSFAGFPGLPAAHYDGNGFGGAGPGGHRVAIDSEGIVLGPDGTFWISDEYGPYIYQFSREGKMLRAIQPPEAYIPRRNGAPSFSSASAPIHSQQSPTDPEDPVTGRNNNQGFEGLALSADGTELYALLQSALMQEGGKRKKTRRHARLIVYDISRPDTVRYVREHVVALPLYNDGSGPKATGNSDILHVGGNQFLILARDGDAGRGAQKTRSVYRQVDVFDISTATDIKSEHNDSATGAIATPQGELLAGIVPAQYFSFLDINDNSELAKFKLHNGGNQDPGLLNEKWESLATVPVNDVDLGSGEDGDGGNEVFLFCFSDNDFVTSQGRMNFGDFHFADSSGFEIDSQVLVFRLTLPQ